MECKPAVNLRINVHLNVCRYADLNVSMIEFHIEIDSDRSILTNALVDFRD